MIRCRHRDRRGCSLVDFFLADGTLAGAFDGHRLFRGRCPRCGDIGLGPANDTPEVLVEVRAAAIAWSAVNEDTGVDWTYEETDGWQAHKYDWHTYDFRTESGCQAGWLAREIWTHEESDRG